MNADNDEDGDDDYDYQVDDVDDCPRDFLKNRGTKRREAKRAAPSEWAVSPRLVSVQRCAIRFWPLPGSIFAARRII